MRKRMIGIVLAAVLVAGGLGSFAYAQEPVNSVHADFCTNWYYAVPGDEFTGGDVEVNGKKEWHADLWNEPDETTAPVSAAELSLDSELVFDYAQEENRTTMGPPTYEWSFGDVPEESKAGAGVGFGSPDPSPAPFIPGFNGSRSADITEFTALGIQTLTITLTPLEVIDGFHIYIDAREDDLVNPVITSPTTDESQRIWLAPDGHWLDILPVGLEVGTPYTYYVTIEVTPKAPKVKFMPRVTIDWGEKIASGTVSGSSVSPSAGGPASEAGTWTWSATGDYTWDWNESLFRGVTFPEYRYELGNKVHAYFDTSWVYGVPGDTFSNDEVTGRKEWRATIWNEPDETTAPVSAAELSLVSELVFDWAQEENRTTMGPPTYKWSFGDVPEESKAGAGMGFASPDPCPATFTPGFDASRSADITEFTAPGTQTLTITLTPRNVAEGFHIRVAAWEDDLVKPVITSPVSGDGINLDPDGHWLDMLPTALEVGTTYTYNVTIEVTPKVPKVQFMPSVTIDWSEKIASGTERGSSVSCPAGDPVGTWTWSADGDYIWYWWDNVGRGVTFPKYRYELGNKVAAGFATNWYYAVPGDTFTNDEVKGRKEWHADIWNEPDETTAPVSAAKLSLDSGLVFDGAQEENRTTMGPPTYEWSFGDVPEESKAGAGVGFHTPDPSPATFTPGFDASRSADITEFTAPGIQTLTITLTPLEVIDGFHIYVDAREDDLVNPVITSPTTDESQRIWLAPDGHWLDILPAGLEIGTTYTYNVTIEVTPKVPKVQFMPRVTIDWGEKIASGTVSGSSVSPSAGGPASEAGTWTWSATGDYTWDWNESLFRGVYFPAYDYQDFVQAQFLSVRRYDVPGENFINHEVIGRKLWAGLIFNQSIEPVNGLTVSLDSELEFDLVTMANRTQMGPSTYEWFLGDAYQWGGGAEVVGFATPDPSPVTFTPGFDASVSADKTEFSGPGTQKLTITVTPREEQVVTGLERIGIYVMTDEMEVDGVLLDPHDLVDAVITSPAAGGGFLNIKPTGLELDTPWTTTVTIQVTPKVPGVVEFMPQVHIDWGNVLDSGIIEGSSVSCPARDPADPEVEVGTWTVSAEGSYTWCFEDSFPHISLRWAPYYREREWSVLQAITSMLAEIEAKLDSGGTFYNFVDNWFKTIKGYVEVINWADITAIKAKTDTIQPAVFSAKATDVSIAVGGSCVIVPEGTQGFWGQLTVESTNIGYNIEVWDGDSWLPIITFGARAESIPVSGLGLRILNDGRVAMTVDYVFVYHLAP